LTQQCEPLITRRFWFVDIPSGGFQRDSGAILCEQPELQGRVLNVVLYVNDDTRSLYVCI
jgi:hypothetical protein